MAKKATKAQKSKQRKRAKVGPKQERTPDHRATFDQLLDDAIFGVKRKDQHG